MVMCLGTCLARVLRVFGTCLKRVSCSSIHYYIVLDSLGGSLGPGPARYRGSLGLWLSRYRGSLIPNLI